MNTMQIRFECMALALRSVPQGTSLDAVQQIAEAIYAFVIKEHVAPETPPQ
jgi:hypothetical protein